MHTTPPSESEIEARLAAMEALITAPFVITLIVLFISAVLITAAIERSHRS